MPLFILPPLFYSDLAHLLRDSNSGEKALFRGGVGRLSKGPENSNFQLRGSYGLSTTQLCHDSIKMP